MPVINYNKEVSFCESSEAAIIVIQSTLVKLRDEANYEDSHDLAPLYAAHNLSGVLRNSQREVEALISLLEHRLLIQKAS